jgi:hypothetical protein
MMTPTDVRAPHSDQRNCKASVETFKSNKNMTRPQIERMTELVYATKLIVTSSHAICVHLGASLDVATLTLTPLYFTEIWYIKRNMMGESM